MVGRVIAAIDLGARSAAVARRAAQLAAVHSAGLDFVHVADVDGLADLPLPGGAGDMRARIVAAARASADGLLAGCLPAGTAFALHVVFGAPHEEIVRLAGEFGADLVVFGPEGRGRRRVLGSTADRVIRLSPVPVLVVRREAAGPYGRIAVAVDFSPQSEAAARVAMTLAPAASVELIHVGDIPAPFEQALRRVGTPAVEVAAYRRARLAAARRRLTAVAETLAGAPGGIAVRVGGGDPATALVRASRNPRLGLLALGRHGRNILHEALIGSVAQRVLRDAACDVLVTGTLA